MVLESVRVACYAYAVAVAVAFMATSRAPGDTHAAAYLSFLGVMRRSTAEADRCRCIFFAPVASSFGSDATQGSASVLVIGSKRGA